MKFLDIPFGTLNLLNYLYFISLNLCPFMYALYVLSLTHNSLKHINKIVYVILGIPMVILAFMIISNPITHAIFIYVDGNYTRGSYQFIMYFATLFYEVFGFIYVLYLKEKLDKEVRFSLSLFLVIALITATIQFFIPQVLLQHFGIAACELIVLLTFQRPDENIDPEHGVFNKKTFDRVFINNL